MTTTSRSPMAALGALLSLVLALSAALLGTASGAAAAPDPAGTPFGHFDSAVVVPAAGGILVSGWAIDPDTTGPIYVWVTVDGVGRHLYANKTRPDLAAAYPASGANHGFSDGFSASVGPHQVCVTASNVGLGVHKNLGCMTASVVVEGTPFGNFESAGSVFGGISVKGWAIDPDTTGPIYVWVTVDGVGRHLYANKTRPDVGAAHPSFGADHGFAGTLRVPGGTHRVCVTASNVGPGAHKSLGCRTVNLSGTPIGNFESVAGVVGGISVKGWAIDPDTTGYIYVWITIDGVGDHLRASGPRPDVAAVYPAYGPDHGFSGTLPASPGVHDVCVTASDVGPGTHRLLGCRSVTSPAVEIAVNSSGAITMPTTLEPRGHAFRVTSAQTAMVTLLEPLNGYTKAQLAADLGPHDSQQAYETAIAHFEANTRSLGGVVSVPGKPGAFGQDLGVGTYWVVDLQREPLEANVATLTVAGTPETTQWPYQTRWATIEDMYFSWLLPSPMPRTGTLKVSNLSTATIRMVAAVKPDNMTLQQWLDLLAAGFGTEGWVLPGTSYTSENVSMYWMYNLPPGQYAVMVKPLGAGIDGAGAVGVVVQ